MTSAPLLGLVGLKRSGKDSVAAALVAARGFRRFAFADALKRAALRSNPIVVDHWYDEELRLAEVVEQHGWENAKEIPEVRRTLQEYGMAIREMDPNFWLRQAMSAADDVRREGIPAVITDVRFTNEADQIEREGGVLVRVVRSCLTADDPHVSENELRGRWCTYTISNDGTLDDLRAAALRLVDQLR